MKPEPVGSRQVWAKIFTSAITCPLYNIPVFPQPGYLMAEKNNKEPSVSAVPLDGWFEYKKNKKTKMEQELKTHLLQERAFFPPKYIKFKISHQH